MGWIDLHTCNSETGSGSDRIIHPDKWPVLKHVLYPDELEL